MKSDIIGTFFKIILLNMFLLSVLASSLYLFRCDFHFLASTLPVCTKRVSASGKTLLSHRPDFPEYCFYLFLQIIVTTQGNCAMFPYIAIGITVFYEGLEVIEQLG